MAEFRQSQLSAGLEPVSTTPASATTEAGRPRPAAVLALFCFDQQPDLLVTERAHHLSHHAGQVSFPGGGIEPADRSVVATALRETQEEIGLAPEAVTVLGELAQPPHTQSRFRVSTVVGSWSGREPLIIDQTEVAAVHRYPVELLTSPRIRRSASLSGGRMGPAFVIDDIVIWGFTALLIDALLDQAGWAEPWDRSKIIEVPQRFRRAGL